jgi:hypothetical protein
VRVRQTRRGRVVQIPSRLTEEPLQRKSKRQAKQPPAPPSDSQVDEADVTEGGEGGTEQPEQADTQAQEGTVDRN